MKSTDKNDKNNAEIAKLLEIHAKQIGLDPKKVKAQLELGLFEGNLKNMGGINLDDRSLEQFLNSERTQTEILAMLNGKEEE